MKVYVIWSPGDPSLRHPHFHTLCDALPGPSHPPLRSVTPGVTLVTCITRASQWEVGRGGEGVPASTCDEHTNNNHQEATGHPPSHATPRHVTLDDVTEPSSDWLPLLTYVTTVLTDVYVKHSPTYLHYPPPYVLRPPQGVLRQAQALN